MEPQTFWVKPLHEVEEQTINLPPADQIGVRFIIPRVLCFKTDADFEPNRFVEGLQSAVAATIFEAPFLAGRVAWQDESTSRIKINIPKDAAVELKVKHLDNISAEELDAAHWPPHKLGYLDLCLAQRGMSHINFCFGLQANIISGGVVIVLHLNHSIVDGYTLSLIQSVFAEHLSRYLNGEPARLSGKIPSDALDRSKICGSHPAKPLTNWRDWKAVDGVVPRRRPLALTVWHMSSQNIDKMRSLVQDGASPARISTANSLSAFLWRSITRARKLSPETVTTMLTPMQARQRVEPALHASYCGNVLVYGRASVPVAELLSQPLNTSGQSIDRSIKWWDSAKIKEYWGSIEGTENLAAVKPNSCRDFGTDFEVSNISNMPFFKMDWGRGLHVRAFRWPGLAVTDGWVNVLPRLPDGSFELMMHLTRDTLEELVKDEEFMSCLAYRGASDKTVDDLVQTEVTLAATEEKMGGVTVEVKPIDDPVGKPAVTVEVQELNSVGNDATA